MKVPSIIFRLCLIALILTSVAGRAHAQQALERMAAPDFDEFYIASSVKLPLTKKIVIADAPVEFSEKWLNDFNNTTGSHYKEMTKERYGKALKEELTDALTDAGWEVVKTPGEDTLRLKPRLFNLNIYAPNGSSLKQVIVRNVGSAIVELDFQTPGNESFMKIVDFRQTQDTIGSPIVANRTNNLRYFKMLMDDWSEDAVKYLDQVMMVVESESKATGQ